MWKPIQCYQTNSNCYKNTTTMVVRGVLWHSTGANNPNLKRYVQPYETDANYAAMIDLLGENTSGNDYNHKTTWRQGMNAVIGKLADGIVTTIQTMPWDYRPWGCGSGTKGSCNNGWIQFECCEDNLNDKEYFEAVYEQACQLTAYICYTYDLDPFGTVTYNGVEVPTITCHKEAHVLGFASNHRDILHWSEKYGKDMDTIRKDVAAIIEKEYTSKTTQSTTTTSVPQLYRVRKAWKDSKSQIGAFSSLEKAMRKCEAAGFAYKVFDLTGKIVYAQTFEEGEIVKIVGENAVYETGKVVPAWLKKKKLFVRETRDDGFVVISTVKIGPITGAIDPQYLERI